MVICSLFGDKHLKMVMMGQRLEHFQICSRKQKSGTLFDGGRLIFSKGNKELLNGL